ncbi:MAG: 50S ribosomal protein L1 [Desulfobacteraceae bacterium]|jgi:large subunit ribosomal protein L1|nr:MAG: 50S ribosomal protein L1 [Desulfobacteraceae bacterium]
MPKRGKKYIEADKKTDRLKKYTFKEAIELAIDSSYVKFDASVDISVRLGVDPRHADQMVRGTVSLPHGIGKPVRVIVFAKGEKEKEAAEAGADFVGAEDLSEKIQKGWLEFDKAVATPDMMGIAGKLGRILGPRGMMPNAKLGTVTFDVAKAVTELKAGKIEFKVDKTGIIHTSIGRVSFGADKLLQNTAFFLDTILRLKPPSSKGTYLKSLTISTSMGPGIKLDTANVRDLISR